MSAQNEIIFRDCSIFLSMNLIQNNIHHKYVEGAEMVKGKYILFINPLLAEFFNEIFTDLKFCLANAIHNFKWVKNRAYSYLLNLRPNICKS